MLASSARTDPGPAAALLRKGASVRADLHLVCGLGCVLLVSVISVLLAMQGWRTRIPAFDLLTYIHSVRELLASGAIPQYGDTGSYGSLGPPGTAWLMLPSTLMFADPRLSEYVGAAILHFLTLMGLFLIARLHFRPATAYLAVPLYGLSAHGIFLAGSLWPIGHPGFYVWVVLLSILWVRRADARLLAAAATVWAVGMYDDMAIAPVCFIPLVLWLLYRPPVRLGPLLIAGAFSLLVWSPYLMYEATRGFADIRSQLLLQGIDVGNSRGGWCDPGLMLRTWGEPSTSSMPQASSPGSLSPLTRLPTIIRELAEKLVSNFESATALPGAGVILLILTLGGLLSLSVSGAPSHPTRRSARRVRYYHLFIAAVGLMFVGPLLSELAIALLTSLGGSLRAGVLVVIRRAETIALTAGVALALAAWLAAVTYALMARWQGRIRPTERTHQIRILALCLIVPWLILLVAAEPGKPERFWWLWPMQVVFLVAFIAEALPSLGTPRRVIWAGLVPVAVLLLANTMLLTRVEAWRRAGWTGPEADEVQVAAYVAGQLGPDRHEAAIGYQVFMYEFMATYHSTNPVYKVGADVDVLFKYLFNVENANRCAEGLSQDDEFRIVQTRPKPEAWSPRMYVAIPPDGRFRLLQEFGKYQVWRRA